MILAIDPGTHKTGYAIFVDDTPVAWGIIKASQRLNLNKRLHQIYDQLREKIDESIGWGTIREIAIESSFDRIDRPMVAEKLGRVRGFILGLAWALGAKVYEYSPREAKKAVLNGKATIQGADSAANRR